MIVGVTGGAGFIGSWVCEQLRLRGHSSFVLDHRGRVDHGMLGSVRDAAAVMEFAAHVDSIIHLAAVLGTTETIDAPLAAAETNIMGTLNVFEAASRYDLPVVFAAVGNANIARGTYCITKSCGERFVDMYREDRNLRVTALRPMNAYGPRQSAPAPYGSSKVRKIVPSFVCAALSGNPMKLYGGGTQYSDSVYVEDVAYSFVRALEETSLGRVPNHPVDVGNSYPHTVLDVAQAVQLFVPDAVIEAIPMRLGEPHGGPIASPETLERVVDAAVGSNPALRRLDVQRVIRELGTVVSADPQTMSEIGLDSNEFKSLHDGIGLTVEWFRANVGVTWNKPETR